MPIRDYEGLKSYIEKIKAGESNVLWKGKPIYLAKTSGTTSGVKYIPISKDSISNHINGARDAILTYMATTGEHEFAGGKMIFLSALACSFNCLLYMYWAKGLANKDLIFIGQIATWATQN